MSKPKHLKKRKRSRAVPFLLAAVVAVGAVYAGAHLYFRAPELPADRPGQEEVHEDDQQAQSQAEAEAAAAEEAARKAHLVRKEDCYTILVSGLDDDNGGADTNMLVTVNAGEGFVHAVSIPRDTKCIYGGKSHKINAAYNSGGMERLSGVIEDQLGIPVDYTLTINLQGFVALVDAIKGVDFYVPIDMDYDDPTQNLSIHFKKGMQHLNGQDAMKVVRFRHNNDGTGYGNEDISRMQTQQDFLKAVAKKMLSPSNLGRIPKLAGIVSSHIKSDNLTAGNLAWLGTEMISMGTENISFSTLPGSWKSPYIYLDEAAVLELVNTYLNPYVEDRLAEDLNIPS